MDILSRQAIVKERRDYNAWVANETLEDYALRFAPRSFRKWSEFRVGNTAFGSISFLVLEAIGGFLTINYGFVNACWAILAVGLVVFLTGLPISYYAAKYNIDMDLLTRGAGFGYIGSTLTSLIYASFTFTLFALEASIMSLALELYFDIPIAAAHVVSALVVIPLVTFGVTTISRLQLWTQPLWIALLVTPYVAVIWQEPQALAELPCSPDTRIAAHSSTGCFSERRQPWPFPWWLKSVSKWISYGSCRKRTVKTDTAGGRPLSLLVPDGLSWAWPDNWAARSLPFWRSSTASLRTEHTSPLRCIEWPTAICSTMAS